MIQRQNKPFVSAVVELSISVGETGVRGDLTDDSNGKINNCATSVVRLLITVERGWCGRPTGG